MIMSRGRISRGCALKCASLPGALALLTCLGCGLPTTAAHRFVHHTAGSIQLSASRPPVFGRRANVNRVVVRREEHQRGPVGRSLLPPRLPAARQAPAAERVGELARGPRPPDLRHAQRARRHRVPARRRQPRGRSGECAAGDGGRVRVSALGDPSWARGGLVRHMAAQAAGPAGARGERAHLARQAARCRSCLWTGPPPRPW